MYAWRQKRAERSRVQAIGAFLDQLEEHPFTVATMWDPQQRHAHYDLERVVSSAETWRERPPHPAISDLLELIHRPASYYAEIDILSATGVTATHNGSGGNLDAMPETMRFCHPHAESYGPFDKGDMKRRLILGIGHVAHYKLGQ
ncbi:hypothetical protein AA0311_2587 [Asaia bogorensis NBRC 16594]|uniref:Uncharacterized protein n=2 Tax=Asaia bogorensis TaxID=91915 RepID=A0AAN4R4B1_9PROT|nr:hypothetical protein AA0311_2587 [Asaia bogorensis NBRC 16594]GEL54903.1 hypothetical protein ABO01nite_29100 [Asaia bogorensis NBRC 16594]